MKKNIALVLLLFLLFTAEAFAAETPRSEFEQRRRYVASMMEGATVWIVVEDDDSISTGSGFIVAEGYVATNAHVVEDMGKNGVVYVLNELIPAREASIVKIVSDEDEAGVAGRDFALLRFAPPKGASLPVLAVNFDLKRMDRVSAWGYPGMATKYDVNAERLWEDGAGSDLKSPPVIYSEGVVNAIVRTKNGDAVLHSAQISRGNSGGPLVNGRGEVVGINTWGYAEEDEGAFLNGAQPTGALAWFLRDCGITPLLAAGQQMPPRHQRTAPETLNPEEDDEDDRRKDVGRFSLTVPHNWSVADEEEDMILLASDDQDTSVGIMILERNGKNMLRVAEELSKKLDGTKPVLDDGLYMFTCSDDGIDTMVFVGETDDDNFLTIFVSGNPENPGVDEILNSVEDN